jgi:hypothetical protein
VRAFRLCSVGLAVIAACTSDESQTDPPNDAGPAVSDAAADDATTKVDGAVDAGEDTDATLAPQCNPLSAFGAPVLVTELSSPSSDWSASLSENGLVVTFTSYRDNVDAASPLMSVFTSTRASINQAWGTPVRQTVFDDGNTDAVTVSADGLTMFLGRGKLWIAQRASTAAPWNPATVWSETLPSDAFPSLLHDGSAVYFRRNQDLYRAPRTAPGAYGTPVKLAWATTAPNDPRFLAVTADELTMYVGARPPTNGPFDVTIARRAKVSDPWGAPAKIDELSTVGPDWPSWTSADGCEVYFGTIGNFDGGFAASFDIWKAKRGL